MVLKLVYSTVNLAMEYLSLFSGVGGLDLGLERSGVNPVAFCEIEKVAKGVLQYHWPDIPCLHDVKEVGSNEYKGIDLISGGFPCQDVSQAGLRKGLAGERSSLWWEFHRIIEGSLPRYVLIENVTGLLSSHKGRDFSTIIGSLVELGYGVSWRVLDAQFFGVPQRRRRVFIVGSLGDSSSTEILFERKSGLRNFAPRSTKRQTYPGETRERSNEIVNSLTRSFGSGGADAAHAEAGWLIEALYENQRGEVSLSDTAYSLSGRGGKPGQGYSAVLDSIVGVRRLTPLECERIMGLPDYWTAKGFIDNALVGHSDRTRYRLCGNGVVPNVTEWIGKRINGTNV